MKEELNNYHPSVRILDDLVRIQSVNPHYGDGARGEQEVSRYVERFFEGTGVKVTRHPVLPGRDNLVIELRTGHAEQTLLFETHMDTVSLGSMVDPTTPNYRDGRLYARGACDAKGSLAGMMWMMKQCAEHPERLAADIVLCAAVDEEFEFRGLRAFMAMNMPIASAVVGEPTNLEIVIAHKGCVRFSVTTHGKAAHSSMPKEGNSAIKQMMRVIQYIEEQIEPELDADRIRHPLCGSPTIVVGTINGGTQINIVPERCEIEIDRRIIPGEDPQHVLEEFENRLRSFADENQLSISFSIRELLLDGALNTHPDSLIVPYARSAARLMDLSDEPVGVSYSSDASKLQKAGIPTIVFGPGSIAQAHSKEEWVSVLEVEQAAEFYLQLALGFGQPIERG
ncbi:MAG: argE [Paenibacillus sp.]|nr:argE [Paenibacillus sp.]